MKTGTLYFVWVVLLFVLPHSYIYAAGIYKWTDADGTVHYGEQPPAQGAKEVHIRPSGAATESQPASRQTDHKGQRDKMIQALEGDRRARQEKKQKQQEEQQKLKAQCAQAKDTLRQYRDAVSLYKLDSQGNRQTMPESAKRQETQRLEAEIKKWCK